MDLPRSGAAIFVGPSLPDLVRCSSAAVLPPIRRGDLPAIVAAGARTVAIVDGEFGQSRAVSVFEIRAALAAGVAVWGASSMGALRAVECARAGMRGVGWIFDGFRTGMLSADDEVALRFDPRSRRAVTVPLVDVRWVLDVLRREGEVTADAAAAAVSEAAAIPYQDRTPSALAQRAAECAALSRVVQFLWTRPAEASRKQLDAQQLLRVLGWDATETATGCEAT
jgi:TfuA protein